MGLLDSLPPGLLNILQNSALNQQMPSGLLSDQANYGPLPQNPAPQPSAHNFNAPSPLDTASWPSGPVGAPSQANATMPQRPAFSMAGPAAASQPPAPASPPPIITAPQVAPAPAEADASSGLGSRLGAGFRGLMANAPSGPVGAILGGVAGLAGMGQPTAEQKQASADNMTAKALLAKNIDPATVQAALAASRAGQPDMLKTLITQNFGPPKAPTALGSGYIWQDGKIVRAYEPEDKTPVGFEKLDNGKMRPIPGGPADPAYLRSKAAGETDPNAVKVLGKGGELYKIGPDGQPVIVHKNEADAEATLDEPTTKAMAAQYLAGDRTVMQNLGRGAQGAANIVKLRSEIYKQAGAAGLDGKGIVDNFNEQAGALAGQRTVGTRAANISLAANEANNMIPIAVAASEAVPRGQYIPINKAVQAIQTGSSSPELARFVAATNSLVNAYVRAVSPSGVPTDSMREHAYHMLNSAQSHDAYVAVTKIMQDEMKAALTAPGQVQKELRGSKAQEGGAAGGSSVKIDGYTITEH
jgi:hypothetical protein